MRTATWTPGASREKRLRIVGSAYVETIGEAQIATWPATPRASSARTVPPLGDRLQCALGVGEEGAARFRQAHAAAPADEQRRADRPLERVQAGGQRRLRHVERVRGAGHRAAADDLDERLQLRMHRQILCK